MQRRRFLHASVLPLAMSRLLPAESTAKPETQPKRILFLCNSLGFYGPNFFPQVVGELETSAYLKDLSDRYPMTVFQNLFHPGMETSNHDSEKSFLTGAVKPESPHFKNTISVDQVLSQYLGTATRYPSLSFSIYDRGWGCSWNERGAAIPPLSDVDQIKEMMFGDEDVKAKRERLRTDQAIISQLQSEMTRDDNGIRSIGTDVYQNVLSELQNQFDREKHWLEERKPQPKMQLSEDSEFPFSNKIRNLLELSKLAFQTDSTRVITLSLDWVYGAIKVPGASGGWHTLSHHGGKANLLNKLVAVELDILKQLRYFLDLMATTPEGTGTLLDHTTIVIGSNFGDSSNHTCNNLPIMVIGGGYDHQGHHLLDQPTKLCNLWLELLHKFDVRVESFGSSEADLSLLGG